MYFETSSGSHGNGLFVSFEQTGVFQTNNVSFYYNKFSISTNHSLKSMGRFKIQVFFVDNTWSTRCNIPKNDRYSNTPTQ